MRKKKIVSDAKTDSDCNPNTGTIPDADSEEVSFDDFTALRTFLEEDLGMKPSDYALVVLSADEKGQRPASRSHRSFENYHCANCGGKLKGCAWALAEAGFSNTISQPLCTSCSDSLNQQKDPKNSATPS